MKDYLGKKYHENTAIFCLVSEHWGGTLHSTIWNRAIGERRNGGTCDLKNIPAILVVVACWFYGENCSEP